MLAERFRDEPGKTMADMLRQVKAEAAEAKRLQKRWPEGVPTAPDAGVALARSAEPR